MKHCPACLHENSDDSAICESCGYAFDSSLDGAKTWVGESTHVSQFERGDIIAGRYRVEGILGQGGMGVVYQVQDLALRGNRIALKMVHPGLISHPEALQRFEEEVLTSQSLTHANIVRVHDLKRADSLRFFTMEYLKGQSLRQWMGVRKTQHPPFNVQETCAVIGQTLNALSYAHRLTVHRDIKPENIMVLGDFPGVTTKLLDFGIARTMSSSRFTQTSQMLGTAYYMAPEQLQGNLDIDHRADLYAVGMVLYEMLTGKMAVGRFPLPGEIIDDIPTQLDAFIDKALAPEPEGRFQDADEMRQLLEINARQPEIEIDAEPPGPRQPEPEAVSPEPERPPKRRAAGILRGLLWGILLVVLLGGGGWVVYNHWLKDPILTVSTTPSGASVFVDNEDVGRSPVRLSDLSDGIHAVRITKDRYGDHEENVVIRQGTPRKVEVTLAPLPFGDLKVTSTPGGARILVDGEPKGTTPATLEMLAQGTRTIALQKKDFEPWQGRADIVPLETTAVEARLVSSFGSLTVTTDPTGAEISLDGQPLGPSPVTIDAVMKGDHTILAKREDCDDATETVTIQPETPYTTHLNMVSIYGSLNIISTPAGADIFLDGNKVGTSPLKLDRIERGTYQVSARSTCYAEAQQKAVVPEEGVVDITLDLASICGGVQITSEPPGALVYLDGQKIGETPLERAGLRQGKQALRMEKAGYPPHKETISIVAGENAQIAVALSKTWVEPSLDMAFTWVPGGCFQMGCGSWSSRCGNDEKPVHEVCLDGFWMSKFEVTQGQWKKIMGDNPSFFRKGDDWPVEQVSWNDARAFIKKLNTRGKGQYQVKLPTEAQWEYAARSGGKQEVYAGGNDVDRLAWFNANSGGKSHPVGTKAPNGLGIHDMSGNVWEWCEDAYHDLAYNEHARNNPTVESADTYRVRRGASWFDAPRDLRSTRRGWNKSNYQISFVGFRLVAH